MTLLVKGTDSVLATRLERELSRSKGYSHVVFRDKFICSDMLCPRKAVLMIITSGKNTEEASIASSLYMGIGEGIHKAVCEHLKALNILVTKEFKLNSDLVGPPAVLPTSGYIDAIIKFPNSKDLVLLEIKSCGNLPDKPKPGHVNQAALYMLLTGIKIGMIYYVSRTVGYPSILQKSFIVYEDQIATAAYSAALAHVCINGKILPPILKDFDKRNCTYCQFHKHCYGKIQAKIDLAEFDIISKGDEVNDVAIKLMENRSYRLEELETKLMENR